MFLGGEAAVMLTNSNEMPIGLKEAVDAITDMGEKCRQYYKHCGVTPPPILIDLAKKNGQTTLTRFYSRVLKSTYGLPSGGVDDYLEFVANGNMRTLKEIKRKLVQAAVYTNTYRGVVSFEITDLADYINESQIDYFLQDVLLSAHDASVLFFIAPDKQHKMTEFIGKLRETMGDLRVIHVSPYTDSEFAEIVMNNALKLGITLDLGEGDTFKESVVDVVQRLKVQSAKDTELVAKKLSEYADYSGYRPVFDVKHMNNACRELSCESEVSRYGK